MKKRIRRRDRQRQSYWEEVMRRREQGDQSVRAFCRVEGIRESAFYFWRRKLADRGQAMDAGSGTRPKARQVASDAPSPKRVSRRSCSTPSFLPVQVVAPASGRGSGAETSQSVEIVLGQGHTVRVRAGFDRQTLVEVLAVLEVRPC